MVGEDEKITVAFKLLDDMVEEEEDIDDPFEDEEDRLTFLFEVRIICIENIILSFCCF